MSSISSRPKVEKISGPVFAAVATAGAVLAATTLQGLRRSLSQADKHTLRSSSSTTDPGSALHPVPVLRAQFTQKRQEALEHARLHLPPIEALRVASAASITGTPFYMDHPAVLEPHLRALQEATTLEAVQRAEADLLVRLEDGHHRLFVETLSVACQRAAAKLGFDRTEIVRLPNEVCVIVTDPTGRSLVTEIEIDSQRDLTLATEVVGVSDGSCQEILDKFDLALEQEGVRSAPPERKCTGGVCELAATRKFVREKIKPIAGHRQLAQPKQHSPAERVRRLNRLPAGTGKPKG